MQQVAAQIAALPAHQRPPMREMGRRSEAAEHPFKALPFKPMPPDEGGAPILAMPLDQGSALTGPHLDPPPRRRPGSRCDGACNEAVPPHPPGNHDGFVPNGDTEHHPSPFRGLDPNSDERAATALARWKAMPAIRYPGDGPHPDKHERQVQRGGSNDPHSAPPGVAAFFDTGRTTAGTLARVVPQARAGAAPATPRDGAAPLVTAHKIGARVEIAAASPAARALGLERGTALTQARACVPGLDVRDADPVGDAAALERLALLLARRWMPTVAIDGADGLLLDLTGVAHLHGGETRLARRLIRLLARHGVTARIGIADTAGAAWALARFGAADRPIAICAPAEHPAALDPLPVAALRLDDHALGLLARLGIDTIGQLRATPRAPLGRRFGASVTQRLDQALGRIAEPLDPVVPQDVVQHVQRFAEPIATPEAIAHCLGQLVPRLAQSLREAGLGARSIELVAERVDGVPQRLRIGLARPNRDAAHLLKLIARRIEEVEPGYGLDALALVVRRADPLGAEALGADLAEEGAPDLSLLVDTLANRIGLARLWRARAVESDVPERSVAIASPVEPRACTAARLRDDDVRRLDGRVADHPWHPRWPRPACLLGRPERLDHVLADLPDKPPLRFTWRGVRHRVIRADGPERIAGEWWRRGQERSAIRDYFHVENEAGQRFWLYRRGDGLRAETGDLSWYMHGAFG